MTVKALVREIACFIGVGGFVTVLSFVLLGLFLEWMNLSTFVAYVSAYGITILISYFLNAFFSFHVEASWGGLGKYIGAYISGMFVGAGVFEALVHGFPHVDRFVLSFAVLPVTTVWNYIVARWCLKGLFAG
jgi:putative flippase GtrA